MSVTATKTATCIDIAKAAGLSGGIEKNGEVYFNAPYRDDGNPSLRINPEKDCWYDDPAGRGGSPWRLVAAICDCDPSDKSTIKTWLNEHGLSNGIGASTVSCYTNPCDMSRRASVSVAQMVAAVGSGTPEAWHSFLIELTGGSGKIPSLSSRVRSTPTCSGNGVSRRQRIRWAPASGAMSTTNTSPEKTSPSCLITTT